MPMDVIITCYSGFSSTCRLCTDSVNDCEEVKEVHVTGWCDFGDTIGRFSPT